MHVTPSELRIVRRGPLLIRRGQLGEVEGALVEIPPSGTAGTELEAPCLTAHWGMVLRGDVELRRNGDRVALPAGSAFHVPEGEPWHTFHASAAAVMVTFAPSRSGGDLMEPGIPSAAPDPVGLPALHELPELPITIAGAAVPLPVGPGTISASAALMGPWVFCRVRLGPTSGYATGWCDLPHWGMVLRGSMALEWEHDVEMLLAGDLFACPGGPPGHRYEAADGATVIDFTPRTALAGPGRAIPWRPTLADIEATSKRMRRRAVACR